MTAKRELQNLKQQGNHGASRLSSSCVYAVSPTNHKSNRNPNQYSHETMSAQHECTHTCLEDKHIQYSTRLVITISHPMKHGFSQDSRDTQARQTPDQTKSTISRAECWGRGKESGHTRRHRMDSGSVPPCWRGTNVSTQRQCIICARLATCSNLLLATEPSRGPRCIVGETPRRRPQTEDDMRGTLLVSYVMFDRWTSDVGVQRDSLSF